MSAVRLFLVGAFLAVSMLAGAAGDTACPDDSTSTSRSLTHVSAIADTRAALEMCDSIRKDMDESFRHKYLREVVPVRMDVNVRETKLEADRNYHELMLRVGVFAMLFCLVGGVLFYFIRHANKKVARSEVEMKDAIHRAELAEKSKSMFLSNMTHEIRTPLNAIAGFSEVLTIPDLEDDLRKESAEIIEMNSNLLQNLIDDVVNTACMDLREMNFRMAACDVVKLCSNVTEMISKIKSTAAEIRFETNAERLTIMVDPLRLQQVLVNVLVNATKFCHEGSIVMRVDNRKEERTAYISVTDTGIGIPKEKQASVFKRFERMNENAEGFGLGLSICQFIVERFGGKIWVDPDYTGGARFVFTLPYDGGNSNERRAEA